MRSAVGQTGEDQNYINLIAKVNSEKGIMQQAMAIAKVFQKGSNRMSMQVMLEMFGKAWKYGSTIFAVKEAVIWGNGFVFPQSVHTKDLEELEECNFDLSELCVRRHAITAQSDLSLRRVEQSFRAVVDASDDLARDIDSAKIVAQHGVTIFTAPGFSPSSVPPPLRHIYITVASAVNRIIYDMYLAGAVLILPTKIVRAIPGVHFSPMH